MKKISLWRHLCSLSLWERGGANQRGQANQRGRASFVLIMKPDPFPIPEESHPEPSFGLRAIESPYHFRDIHTTILHQLGLDQHRLTFPHLGRNERLTFVEGKVIREIV